MAGAVAIGESAGWPFLAAPLQGLLSDALGRRVQFSAGADFRVRFIGGLRLHAAGLEIAAPAWSSAPHLLRADGVELGLRYSDLWRAHRGQRLRIEHLQAAALDAHLERDSQGRVSWQWATEPSAAAGTTPLLPLFGTLKLGAGQLHYRDAPGAIDVQAQLRWSAGADNSAQPRGELRVNASGTLRQLPLKAQLVAWGVTPATATGEAAQPLPLTLTARIGRAQLDFEGTALDALKFDGLLGRFKLAGPSLAAVGDAVGVTLPTTGAFHSHGAIRRDGPRWQVVVDAASIGGSQLGGAFRYEADRRVPLLSGRLVGSRLLLVDLGPVVGTTTAAKAAPILPAAAATAAAVASAPAATPAVLVATTRGRDKVLPDRPFDLAALRVMDANVLVDINTVDLNTALLKPLQPLRGHLQLSGGVLSLSELDARTAQGHLQGTLKLDGRTAVAQWTAAVHWDGLRLEHWIRQDRSDTTLPFVSGRLSGRATVSGQGRSTAEILASLGGNARTELHGGAISHLVIEAAGLDLAQSLGVLIRGDKPLPVTCGVADLVAQGGVFRTRVMVLDTTDSTVWIDGTVSLATEALDLRAVVSPKDASPLALRTPLRVQGSLAQPQVSIEKGRLGRKLAASFLLGLINPLAALIPLIDPGNTTDAERGATGCRALMAAGAPARPAR